MASAHPCPAPGSIQEPGAEAEAELIPIAELPYSLSHTLRTTKLILASPELFLSLASCLNPPLLALRA